jgi:hypothetical protein
MLSLHADSDFTVLVILCMYLNKKSLHVFYYLYDSASSDEEDDFNVHLYQEVIADVSV